MAEKKLPLLQIVDYDANFENFKSRTVDRCTFVCVPNKHGGTGLSNVLAEENGGRIYGIWILILEICSRQRKPRHGFLTADGKKDGRRLGIRELSNQLRRPDSEIEEALRCVTSAEVGWIRIVNGDFEWIPESQRGNTVVSEQYSPSISNSDAEGRNEGKNSISKAEQERPNPEQLPTRDQTNTAVSEQYPPMDTVGMPEAQRILAGLAKSDFPDEVPGAIWDYELERKLSEQIPLNREILELVTWAYRLPADDDLFVNGKGGMQRRQSFAALIPNLKSEASKIRAARKKIGLNGIHADDAATTEQSDGWTTKRRAAFGRLFPDETKMPGSFWDLGSSVQRQIDEVKK